MVIKSLLLFSGGLDSRVAVRVLEGAGLKVEGIFFKLPFGSQEVPKMKGLKVNVIDVCSGRLFKKYLRIVKNAKHGYGCAMNPCKDCKIFLLKEVKKFVCEKGFDVIAMGDVLGQRPMTQKKSDMIFIDKKAGLSGKVLRPLSAKLLDETIYEKKGLVSRKNLLDIQGRVRRRQIKVAYENGLDYPNPGGGCLLCEKDYCVKLRELLDNKEVSKIEFEEIKLLKYGRHFWGFGKRKGQVVLGRDEKENKEVERLGCKLGWKVYVPKFPGPSAIYEFCCGRKRVEELVARYGKRE